MASRGVVRKACSKKDHWQMKVGIVTFFRAPNYGAMLQAYALCHYLKDRGHEVEFIDYAFGNTRRIPLWKCFIVRNLHNCIDTIRRKMKMYVRFDIVHFADNIPRSQRVSTFESLKNLGKKYYAVIVGSDQMWNPVWCSESFLPIVMLDFVPKGVKRVSYAVSFGTKVWRSEQNAEVAGRLLREFDAISVREESGVDLVRELSGREDVKWVIDPTLLHTALFYKNLFNDECKKENKYILSYVLDEWLNNDDIESVLRLVKSCTAIKEVHTDKIPVKGVLSLVCKALRVQSKMSVGKWLSEIANADFVVTNSFHGTVFSILFHKPFLTIPVSGSLSGMNERVVSLLTMVGLESRIVKLEDVNICIGSRHNGINWAEVDRKLDSEKTKADAFLQSVLLKREL